MKFPRGSSNFVFLLEMEDGPRDDTSAGNAADGDGLHCLHEGVLADDWLCAKRF
jgi:hypothetical protein